MTLTRRSMLSLSAGAAVGIAAGLRGSPALASADDAMAKVMEFSGGSEPSTGTVSLTAPEIAENGNTVPISVSVDSPMTEGDHVTSVAIFADGNPSPEVIVFNFSPLSGEASATTRMRLAKTQNVIAVAKTSTGAVFMDKKEVKVTIGGCGG
ncbi:thiosulfate oxidation carrier protein SoxY [Oricola sp.]|uniref:thiosulfate oxidation carrier protein SoxY n=1 Tax=Oricola sp. TaxID=1979950 RepID=UPI003BAB0369